VRKRNCDAKKEEAKVKINGDVEKIMRERKLKVPCKRK